MCIKFYFQLILVATEPAKIFTLFPLVVNIQLLAIIKTVMEKDLLKFNFFSQLQK